MSIHVYIRVKKSVIKILGRKCSFSDYKFTISKVYGWQQLLDYKFKLRVVHIAIEIAICGASSTIKKQWVAVAILTTIN